MIADSRYIPLKDKSVNAIITSPPYWSLRKYDIPDLIWDGEEGCEHKWVGKRIIPAQTQWNTGGIFDPKKRKVTQEKQEISDQFCLHCSAWRGQLGLEPTIELFLKHLMQIMDECWRVLKDDGTMWVNLGDSYGYSGRGGSKSQYSEVICGEYLPQGGKTDKTMQSQHFKPFKADIKMDKSLCLIPERFAIEMVNSNWELRDDLTEEETKYILTELTRRGIINHI